MPPLGHCGRVTDRLRAAYPTFDESSLERWITVEEGTSSVFVIERHRSSTDGPDFAFGHKLQIVDFELKLGRFTGPGRS
jgi:hypothetical protein